MAHRIRVSRANLARAIEGEKIGMDTARFDKQFVACSQKIELCLEAYFREHETEFVEWVP